jgi:antitoxin component of RelBE/YafQ-DinJ toxin-antitoxin module
MNTQVLFKIDKKLKERAMKKAQEEGVSFTSVLKFATKAYVDGDLTVSLIPTERFNEKTRKELARSLADVKAGKNISPVFDSVEESLNWLKS